MGNLLNPGFSNSPHVGTTFEGLPEDRVNVYLNSAAGSAAANVDLQMTMGHTYGLELDSRVSTSGTGVDVTGAGIFQVIVDCWVTVTASANLTLHMDESSVPSAVSAARYGGKRIYDRTGTDSTKWPNFWIGGTCTLYRLSQSSDPYTITPRVAVDAGAINSATFQIVIGRLA